MRLGRLSVLSLFSALMGALLCGCAHSRPSEDLASMFYVPEVPAFLSGPMAVLLTKSGGGYSARVTLTSGSGTVSSHSEVVTGQLLGRDDQLLFAPDPGSLDKRLRAVGLSYIWNVKDNRGYVLSESLQGWAPIGFNVQYTNVVASRTDAVPERLEGQLCIQEQARVASTEAAVNRLEVWRAPELHGLPLRIASGPGTAAQSLTLSHVRLAAPAAELFVPPDSFTHYQSADVMMSELVLRQHNLKKHPAEGWDEKQLPPGMTPANPYQGPTY